MHNAQRTGQPFRLAARLIATIGAGTCIATGSAWAAPGSCDGSSDACSFDLGRVIVTLDQGAASYSAGAEFLSGDDGDYVASPSFFGTLALQQSGATEGFSFLPGLQLRVGGSGLDGWHELRGWFEFTGLRFQAKPGWRLDGLRFEVTGGRNVVGDASWYYGLPFGLDISGGRFAGGGPVNPDDAALRAELTVNAAYQQGEDGTAVSYGYATTSFDTARFVATVSAVPEPQTVALWLLGAGLLGARLAQRRTLAH